MIQTILRLTDMGFAVSLYRSPTGQFTVRLQDIKTNPIKTMFHVLHDDHISDAKIENSILLLEQNLERSNYDTTI